jgi:hypothetical protein
MMRSLITLLLAMTTLPAVELTSSAFVAGAGEVSGGSFSLAGGMTPFDGVEAEGTVGSGTASGHSLSLGSENLLQPTPVSTAPGPGSNPTDGSSAGPGCGVGGTLGLVVALGLALGRIRASRRP